MRIRVKYVHTDRDRHGNVRVYFQRGRGPKVRLRNPIGSPAFLLEYDAALKGTPVPKTAFSQGTFGALIEAYTASHEFRALKSSTQSVRRRILDKMKGPHGHKLVKDMEPRHVRSLRDEKDLTSHAANNRLKVLKTMFSWAVEALLMETNPGRDVPKIKVRSDGHHCWTADEINQFRARHPEGSKARLAFALLFYTAARKSDMVGFGRQSIENGCIRYRAGKTGAWVIIPIAKQLRDEIDRLPKDQMIFLVTEFGKPFTANGFGNWFRARCDEAGLPGCSAHGLRKAAATIAATGGASAHGVKALGGWASLAEAERYTRKADGEKLAGQAVSILERNGDK